MEFARCRKNLSRFSVGRDVRTRVVNDIALAAAGLKIVGVLLRLRTKREHEGVESDLVVARLSGHAVTRGGDRHVRRQEGGVVRRREPSIRGDARDRRVGQVASNESAEVIELVFGGSVGLDVAACQ